MTEQAWETVFKPFTMKICEVLDFYKLSLKDRVLKKGLFLLLSLLYSLHFVP
jgi:hypothetical protein